MYKKKKKVLQKSAFECSGNMAAIATPDGQNTRAFY